MEASVARHPDRFPGFVASLPMNNVDAALAELERAREASQRTTVIGAIAPSPELIEPATDPPLAERDHRAKVVRNDEELGMAFEESGEDPAPHRHACLRHERCYQHFAFVHLGSYLLAPDEHPDIMGAARHRNVATVEERLRVPQLRFDDEIAPRSPVESLPNGRRS